MSHERWIPRAEAWLTARGQAFSVEDVASLAQVMDQVAADANPPKVVVPPRLPFGMGMSPWSIPHRILSLAWVAEKETQWERCPCESCGKTIQQMRAGLPSTLAAVLELPALTPLAEQLAGTLSSVLALASAPVDLLGARRQLEAIARLVQARLGVGEPQGGPSPVVGGEKRQVH